MPSMYPFLEELVSHIIMPPDRFGQLKMEYCPFHAELVSRIVILNWLKKLALFDEAIDEFCPVQTTKTVRPLEEYYMVNSFRYPAYCLSS